MAIWNLSIGGPAGSERRWSPIAYPAALALFVATAWAGAAALPERHDSAAPLFFVVVALLLAPASTACNAAEYAATARLVDVRVSARQAFRVAVLSTAANLLPVPGSPLLRVVELRRAGGGSVRATGSVLAASAAWVGVTGASLGVVAMTLMRPLVGTLFLVGAFVLLVFAYRLGGAHRSPTGGRDMALLLAVEGASTAVAAARLWCCARGLGFDIHGSTTVALASASVMASVLAIAPGGLGVREALAAAIAPVVGIPAAVGASVAALDRLIGSAVVALGVAGLALADHRGSGARPDTGTEARR